MTTKPPRRIERDEARALAVWLGSALGIPVDEALQDAIDDYLARFGGASTAEVIELLIDAGIAPSLIEKLMKLGEKLGEEGRLW